MSSNASAISRTVLIAVGLAIGVAVSAVDNFAFGGEVSPFVIVILLLGTTVTSGILWGGRGWIAAILVWLFLPLAHVVKHIFSLPDTLHPNTCASILKLAVFSFVIAAIGFGGGVLIHSFGKTNARNGTSRHQINQIDK